MDIYGGEVSSKLDSAMAEGLDELITPVQMDWKEEESRCGGRYFRANYITVLMKNCQKTGEI